jgi:hypothetical protein
VLQALKDAEREVITVNGTMFNGQADAVQAVTFLLPGPGTALIVARAGGNPPIAAAVSVRQGRRRELGQRYHESVVPHRIRRRLVSAAIQSGLVKSR